MKKTLGLLAGVVVAGATLAPVLWADCDGGDPVFLQADRRELVSLKKILMAEKAKAERRVSSKKGRVKQKPKAANKAVMKKK